MGQIKDSESPVGIKPINSRTLGRRFIHRAKRTRNIGVCIPLTEASTEYRFILQNMWEENLGTRATVH